MERGRLQVGAGDRPNHNTVVSVCLEILSRSKTITTLKGIPGHGRFKKLLIASARAAKSSLVVSPYSSSSRISR